MKNTTPHRIGGVDLLLWPLVARWGKAAAVIIVAAATATLTLVGQRLLNDHARLVVAKQRWQRLQAEAALLPPESPRRARLAGASSGVLTLVAGDSAPPAPRALETGDSGPLRAFRVEYREARTRGDRIFWAPFAPLGWSWDAGWIGVYLAVYLPLLAFLRLALRLP